ncbi:DUF4365 domain-containing protein [Moorena sp. SIO2C4]|uniref:DUF4365 domain-containing protein n=1 Tax=Moorena sp. SIO2C4 TaxID=2607824 RepID=UPI0013BEC8C0|nr:DUF4365 domain-containing protein [Moorena sp. SIO2C4]NEQ14973.1 DUF4365 domain-containing protein [Moorena sp. SIO3E2]NES45624.1 DUF4365 domain-containing protein [Moorena sp. SIO2C4]
MKKNKRPREQIIADLSINYVERYILLCGYSVQRVELEYTYGFDLIIFTYDANSELENGKIYVKLKATDFLSMLSADQETIGFPLGRSDIEPWLKEPMPCILIVYDAQLDLAYWLYLQAYFENWENFDPWQMEETITVNLPKKNIINQNAIKKFARYKNDVLRQLPGVIRYRS